VFARHFDLPHGRGLVVWTPEDPGEALLRIRALGHQDQTATVTLALRVHPAPRTTAPPTVELLHIPRHPTVGVAGRYVLRAAQCHVAVARIEGAGQDDRVWRFPCPADSATFHWTPTKDGSYQLTIDARTHQGVTASQTVGFTVAPAPTPIPSPSP
jgi:hypothetical protein